MKPPHFTAALILAAMLAGCSEPIQTRKLRAPRLTIVIVIDQFRYDYVQRFAGYWQGGIGRLLKEGAVFSNAHHEHALTECAPGHATLLTGSHPARHGIVADLWYDRGHRALVHCVDDTAYATLHSSPSHASPPTTGKSPLHLLCSTLGDWMKSADPQARVVSVSGMAPPAVLMGGHEAQAVYWPDPYSGDFVSSTYYMKSLPSWLSQWNARRYAQRYRETVWEKSLPEAAYFASREDLFTAEGDGLHTTFPHRLEEAGSGTDTTFYQRLSSTPFGDLLTLEFAQSVLQAHELGKDPHPDLLCLSLSSTAAVGRAFGPLSQEMQDHLLRLDVRLGNFFAWLEAEVGLQNCWIVFASDHGVLPMPEELRRRGLEAARVSEEEMRHEILNLVQEMAPLPEDGGQQADSSVICLMHGVYLSQPQTAESVQEEVQQLANKLQSLSFVESIHPAGMAAPESTPAGDFHGRFRNAHFPGRSPDLFLHRKPYFLLGGQKQQGTQHGSEYDYDTHVPLVLWGAIFKEGKYESKIATVDVAPTLAAAMGIEIPQQVDGKVLHDVLTMP